MNTENYNSFHPKSIQEPFTKELEIQKSLTNTNSTKSKIKDFINFFEEKPKNTNHNGNGNHEARLDLIDKEILVNDDKLITNLDVTAFDIDVEFIEAPKKTKESTNNLNRSVNLDKKQLKTKELSGTRSANHSPLRMNKNQLQKKIDKEPISASAQKKSQETVCPKTVTRVRDVAKFINKPKSNITTTDNSRNNSVTTTCLKKKKSTLLNKNVSNFDKTLKSSRNISSPLPLNSTTRNENNNKVITDLQTMFGKNVEHFEEMYANLSENDKKNLISALLAVTFDLKAQNDKLLQNNKKSLDRTRGASLNRINGTPVRTAAHRKSNSISYPEKPLFIKKN